MALLSHEIFANPNSRNFSIQFEEPSIKFGSNVETNSEVHEGLFWIPSSLDLELDVNMPQYVLLQYIP